MMFMTRYHTFQSQQECCKSISCDCRYGARIVTPPTALLLQLILSHIMMLMMGTAFIFTNVSLIHGFIVQQSPPSQLFINRISCRRCWKQSLPSSTTAVAPKITSTTTTCSIATSTMATASSSSTSTSLSSLKLYKEEYDQIWMFRNLHPIQYDRFYSSNAKNTTPTSTTTAATTGTNSIQILLLNGFGMGTFHQHRFMKEIMVLHQGQQQHHDEYSDVDDTNVVIYAMDYIGQGKSWPINCNDGNSINEDGLQYSAQTWMEQIIQFMEQVIIGQQQQQLEQTTAATNTGSNKVHLVGNSLGGYLATYVAATRPDLIESLCLLNATPIWGLNLPGWDGYIRRNNTPILPKIIGRYLFDVMRSTSTIEQFLNATYVNDPIKYHTNFIEQIQSGCMGLGGHVAFASILWSPPISINMYGTDTSNYYDCLKLLQNTNVLLCYGQNDPWCKPAFAKKILSVLQQEQEILSTCQSIYLELSQVGHCPNHEAPVATAYVLSKWISNIQSKRNRSISATEPSSSSTTMTKAKIRSLFPQKQFTIKEDWGETIIQERTVDEISLSVMDEIALTML